MYSRNSSILALVQLLIIALLTGSAPVIAEEDMPGRIRFPDVQWLSTEQLHKLYPDKVTIVDVRSQYEYETLHIKGAINIVYGGDDFLEQIRTARESSPQALAFYCNGRDCLKSYQAAKAVQESGIDRVYAYDAGVFSWVEAYPDDSVLLGQSPVDPDHLIREEKRQAHMRSPAEFEQLIGDTTLILDIRDTFQQEATNLFPLRQHSVPLDNKALKTYIDRAARENKTLLIYDQTGQQVRWLQYFLEAHKVRDYYFMAGGAKGYYEYIYSELGR